MFTSHVTKSKAEKFKTYILKAFENVLGSPVTIEIRSELRKETRDSYQDAYAKRRSEIVEVDASPREPKAKMHNDNKNSSVGLQRRLGEQSQSRSLVRGKVSLADVIQHAESKRNGWSTRKAVSIAEKLEQENLRMEPRSRSLLCWKASRVVARRKVMSKLLNYGYCCLTRCIEPRVAAGIRGEFDQYWFGSSRYWVENIMRNLKVKH
ncbi:hypothetical protein Hdeb2414_s0008g00293911 [Helianthus debilis subsp. tardiflorus]